MPPIGGWNKMTEFAPSWDKPVPTPRLPRIGDYYRSRVIDPTQAEFLDTPVEIDELGWQRQAIHDDYDDDLFTRPNPLMQR